jgi:hypothetical protein
LQQCGANTLFSDTLAAQVAEDASYRVRHIALGQRRRAPVRRYDWKDARHG